ncbi:MAG TPA: FHA domain-containing protein [Phycisphaerae bacterium]|nr:FHA domain-containing protein [Phycisphaerae bacterium]
MIHLQCGCGQRIKLPESQIGKAGACQVCKQVLRVVATDFEPEKDDLTGVLVIRRGPKRKGEHIFLGGHLPIEIGKFPGVGILLAGTKVSRTHCRLTRTEFGWRIEDQKSTNGLFVNGQRTAIHELQDGDSLRIGEFILRYVAGSPAHFVDDASSEAPPAPPPAAAKPGPPPVAVPVRPAKARAQTPSDPRRGGRQRPPPIAELVEPATDNDEWYEIADDDVLE